MWNPLRDTQRRVMLFCSVLLILLLVVGGASAQSASWTVMFYIDGDNNLEGDALTDLQELELIGSSDEVNIVVQVDRAEGFSAGDGDWTDARRYLVEYNPANTNINDIILEKFGDTDLTTLGTRHLESLGETNNGDTQTLIDFAEWAVTNYPAEKYALVFWNHGGTWIGGFGGDESTEDHDGMNMVEIDESLSTITDMMGQKFEFIGFDTCLMGGYEVFAMLSDYAHYGAASEELEPGFGWYHSPVMETLVNNPSVNGGDMAQAVVTGYMDFYDNIMVEVVGDNWYSYAGQPYGQTAVDFSQMDALDAAMNRFVSVAVANMDSPLVSAIGDARNNTQLFNLSSPDDVEIYASADLMHFMELLIRFSENADVDTAAQDVIDAINNLVILHDATGLDGARGVSIYFPANQGFYEIGDLNQRYANEVPYMSEWTRFLEAFYGLAISDAADNENSISISNIVQIGETVNTLQPPTLVIDTVGTDIVSLGFNAILTLDDGSQYMIDSSALSSATITEDGEELTNIPDGESSTQFTWGVDMPIVTDGTNAVDTVLLETGDDNTLAVTGDYFFNNGDTVPAYIVFNIASQQAASFWGLNQSETGGQPFEINTTQGEVFIPDWRYFDEEGNVQLQSTGVELVIGDEPFRYDYAPAQSGNYTLYVFMTDVAGNTFIDATQLVVDNDGIDTTYRGAADVNFGYNTIYPFDWFGALDVESEDGAIRTEYADNDDKITVFYEFYDATSMEEMDIFATEYLEIYALETFDTYEITVGGYDGIEVGYYSQTEDGQDVHGVIAYTVVPENGLGYIIDYTVFGEDAEGDYVYYSDLINNITFFPPLVAEMPTEDGGDEMGAMGGTEVADLIEEYGYTVEEIDEALADSDITVADIQADVDAGLMTIEDVEAALFEE